MKKNLLSILKQAFSSKSSAESESGNDKVRQVQNEDEEVPGISLDDMSRKLFYRSEAAYRHQRIVLPRYKSETGILVGDVLEKLFPQIVDHVTDMVVLKTIELKEIETTSTHFTNKEEAFKYDLFWAMNYKNDEGEIYPISGTNISLVINTNGTDVPPYIVIFVRGTAIGFDETYIRLSLMVPSGAAVDDLRTTRSNSVPTITSLLIACDKKDNPKQFIEYEEAEQRVMNCINKGIRLRDDIDAELCFGLREFQPASHYIGYGKWLYENKRYHDAYENFMRAIKAMKSHRDDNMNEFYETCKYTARCLMEHNHWEMAGYYYSLAFSGIEDSDREQDKFWVAIADPRALSFTYSDLVEQYGDDRDKWPEEAKNRYHTNYYYYTKNCDSDKERAEKVSFFSDLALVLVLGRLLNIEDNNIQGMNVISSDGVVTTIKDKEQICNESIYKYLSPGTTIVLPYSKAYYATGDTEDKSILNHASSIIIRVDSAKNDTNLVRVNIMVPNFNTDDDKHDMSDDNIPISISFIMSSADEPKVVDEKDISVIYEYAEKCVQQNRFIEAQIAFLMVYKKLSVDYLNLSEENKELFYRSAYNLGFCSEELQKHETALFYLELASSLRIDTHIQEFINALSNNRDPRALDVIRNAKNASFNANPDSEEYRFHYAFLNRREAYVLIDLERYDEAEELLKSMLSDPSCKEFAEGELKYIEQLKS